MLLLPGKSVPGISQNKWTYNETRRLSALITCYYRLSLGVFLVNFELTIVSTALVNIANDFQSFSMTSWIITAYLITYVGKNPALFLYGPLDGTCLSRHRNG